jgi:hypothetical protein
LAATAGTAAVACSRVPPPAAGDRAPPPAVCAGAPDEAFKLGDHTLGRPFHEYKPEKNVFQDLSNDGADRVECSLIIIVNACARRGYIKGALRWRRAGNSAAALRVRHALDTVAQPALTEATARWQTRPTIGAPPTSRCRTGMCFPRSPPTRATRTRNKFKQSCTSAASPVCRTLSSLGSRRKIVETHDVCSAFFLLHLESV